MLPTNCRSIRIGRQTAHICNGTKALGPQTSQPGARGRRGHDTSSKVTGVDDVPSWTKQHKRPHGPSAGSRLAPASPPAASQTSSSSSSNGSSSSSSSNGSASAFQAPPNTSKPAAKPAPKQRHPREIAARKNPELYSLTQPDPRQTVDSLQDKLEVAGNRTKIQNQQQQQQHWQQQQGQQRSVEQTIPWLSSTAGSVVGSTGSFRPTQEAAGSTSSSGHGQQNSSSSNISSTSMGISLPTARLSNRPQFKPEVLAPAGGWPQLRAAVENGADAVYFGVTGFNARARAANFEPSELPEVMAYLHERGVKGYVALNVLVFDGELPRLEQLVRQLAAAGVDAVIVQDIGAVALIRTVAPQLAIHGSTQMSITSAEGAEFAAGLGVSRVVVGRELSVGEIAKLSSSTGVEVEAFCHGALCVSYSGQCYSSEAWGGRSANRGQCAQACRMPYGLIVDGQIKDLADISYLLSPQDLMALEQLPAMVAAGVGCFKIEGRLKGPEYVAATTAAYRAGVDAAWEQLLLEEQQHQERLISSSTASSSSSRGSHSSSPTAVLPPELLRNLAQVFSRGQDDTFNGLTPGFLEGSKHQRLVRGRAPRHRGLCLGRISAVTDRGVIIEGLLNPVKRGDGLVFDQGTPELEEEGGAVWDIFAAGGGSKGDGSSSKSRRGGRSSSGRKIDGEAPEGSAVELVFGPGQVRLSKLSRGSLVWKNRDSALEAQLRDTYEAVSSSSARKLLVQVSVTGSLGTPLQLQLTDPQGNTASADTGDIQLQAASKRALTAADVEAAVGQLGDNSLAPAGIDLSGLALDQGLFLPASAFKAVRRAAAEQLLHLRRHITYDQGMPAEPVLPGMLAAATTRGSSNSSSFVSGGDSSDSSTTASSSRQQRQQQPGPTLRVLCRTPGQVEAALQLPWLDEVILDFLEVHGLKEAVAAVQGAGRQAVVAMPRILKPDESRLLWFYLKLGADALLLRGAGCLQQLLELGGPGAVVQGLDALSSSSSSSKVDSSSVNHGDSTSSDCDSSRSGSGYDSSSGGSSSSQGSAVMEGAVVIPKLEGDFSLNAANVLAADLLLAQGLSRLCPTHDLNAAQLAGLAEGLGGGASSAGRAGKLEAIVHQHLPIFHTEHCVFCRFLSKGNSYLDCGHPCERHTVQLRDSAGADHLVLADMGCRNTVFNASAQSGLYYLPRLAAAGYGTFRIELVDEPPHLVAPLLEAYRSVLQGKRRPADVWEWLKEASSGGVSAGSLDIKAERAATSLRPTARRR